MKFQRQLSIKTNPSEQYLDCYRTALACILNKSIEDVPSHILGEDGNPTLESQEEITAWLQANKVCFATIPMFGIPLEGALQAIGGHNPSLYYLLIGQDNENRDRVVICLGNMIIWDPSLEDGNLTRPAPQGLFCATLFVQDFCIDRTAKVFNG